MRDVKGKKRKLARVRERKDDKRKINTKMENNNKNIRDMYYLAFLFFSSYSFLPFFSSSACVCAYKYTKDRISFKKIKMIFFLHHHRVLCVYNTNLLEAKNQNFHALNFSEFHFY